MLEGDAYTNRNCENAPYLSIPHTLIHNLLRRLQNFIMHDRSILGQLVLFEAVFVDNLHLLNDCTLPRLV